MQLDFLMAGSDQMVDDVGRGSVSTSATEPFAAAEATNNAAGIMNSAVTGQC